MSTHFVASPYARCFAALMWGALAAYANLAQAETYLQRLGGPGGGEFIDLCAANTNLAGVELRTADDVDAIRPICVPTYGRTAVGPHQTALVWHGGSGGRPRQLVCPPGTPLVSGISIDTEGVDTTIVNSVRLYCTDSGSQRAPNPNPSALFEGPTYVPSKPALGFGVGGELGFGGQYRQDCPSGQVAVGIHGRSGKWLDAVGLACDSPRLIATPGAVASIGRMPGPASGARPSTSICEAAAVARARGSPAAGNLEAQCRAQNTVGSIGRSNGRDGPGRALETICDRALAARERNSPAAASLEAQCTQMGGRLAERAADGPPDREDLLARGESMGQSNALAMALREMQPEGPVREGFDIGLATTGADTVWGPGKQKILDSLPRAQQEGFKLAASLAMDQNRNPELARTGAAIADGDAPVARARKREADPRYWLGFDIRSGLLGDPALGSRRNSTNQWEILAIRDSMAGPAQRGFVGAVRLHQTRNY